MSLTRWHGQIELDDRWVAGIDEMLYPASRSNWRKQPLVANKGVFALKLGPGVFEGVRH